MRELYRRFVDDWNRRDAAALAAPFAEDGEIVGFDGGQLGGRFAILANQVRLSDVHWAPPYLTIVRGVRRLGADVAVRRAVVWWIALLQTTPAQLHGHPELVEQLTAKLRALRQRQRA